MTKFIKKLLTMCTVAVIAMMQVTSASAVTATYYAEDWIIKQGIWDVSLYDTYIMSTTSQYCINGVSKDSYAFDSGDIQMIIHCNSLNNIVKNYLYGEIYQFGENEMISDSTQNGTSTAYIELLDNYYGNITNKILKNN